MKQNNAIPTGGDYRHLSDRKALKLVETHIGRSLKGLEPTATLALINAGWSVGVITTDMIQDTIDAAHYYHVLSVQAIAGGAA